MALHWTLCYVHLSLLLGSPKLDTALQVWHHQCGAEGKDHYSQAAGNTPARAAQDTISLICSKDILVAYVQLGVCQVLFCKAALQVVDPSVYWCMGLLLLRCRTWYFPLWNLMRFLSAHFSSLSRSLWMAA